MFTAVQAILEDAQASVLKPLEDRRKLLVNEARGFKDELEAEITKLERTISDLDDVSVLEDHILFLQVRQKMEYSQNILLLFFYTSMLLLFLSAVYREAICFFIPFIFLYFQKYPSLSLQDEMNDWADVKLDTSLSFGIMRETTTNTIDKIQQELDKLASIGELHYFSEKIRRLKC